MGPGLGAGVSAARAPPAPRMRDIQLHLPGAEPLGLTRHGHRWAHQDCLVGRRPHRRCWPLLPGGHRVLGKDRSYLSNGEPFM